MRHASIMTIIILVIINGESDILVSSFILG